MNETKGRIVAAVAGDEAQPLLRFATDEASRSGCDLHLVHVITKPPKLPDSDDLSGYQTPRKFGELILDRAAHAARDLVTSRVHVTQELVEDSQGTVNDIVVRSRDARLLVVQHRRLSGLRKVTSASTTQSIASRAHCPVVSVPESWQPAEMPFGRVTVAIHEPSRADAILRTAFELADERQSRVRVAHAWCLARAYDPVVVDYELIKDLDERFRAGIDVRLAEFRAQYPDVDVEIQELHEPLGLALVNATEQSDLLVLGRRHAKLPFGSHLGPATRQALRASEVPVVLVETARPPAVPASPPLKPLHVMY